MAKICKTSSYSTLALITVYLFGFPSLALAVDTVLVQELVKEHQVNLLNKSLQGRAIEQLVSEYLHRKGGTVPESEQEEIRALVADHIDRARNTTPSTDEALNQRLLKTFEETREEAQLKRVERTCDAFESKARRADTVQAVDKVMTIEQWKKVLAKAHLPPLTQWEVNMINKALQYEGKNYGGVVNRTAKDFHGSTLIMGTGWDNQKIAQEFLFKKLPQLKMESSFSKFRREIEQSTFNIEDSKMPVSDSAELEFPIKELISKTAPNEALSLIYKLQNWASMAESIPFAATIGDDKGAYKITPKDKELLKKKLQKIVSAFSRKVDPLVLAKFNEAVKQSRIAAEKQIYTVDINDKVKPDLVGSVTSEQDMAHLPSAHFEHVILENIDCNVYLDPATWRIMERITKPGGKITIGVASDCHRLAPFVMRNTKWRNDIKPSYYSDPNSNFDLVNHE